MSCQVGDVGEVGITKAGLASLFNKKAQAPVFRVRLKCISAKEMILATDLHAEEL